MDTFDHLTSFAVSRALTQYFHIKISSNTKNPFCVNGQSSEQNLPNIHILYVNFHMVYFLSFHLRKNQYLIG